jgi:hypothetical protein
MINQKPFSQLPPLRPDYNPDPLHRGGDKSKSPDSAAFDLETDNLGEIKTWKGLTRMMPRLLTTGEEICAMGLRLAMTTTLSGRTVTADSEFRFTLLKAEIRSLFLASSDESWIRDFHI